MLTEFLPTRIHKTFVAADRADDADGRGNLGGQSLEKSKPQPFTSSARFAATRVFTLQADEPMISIIIRLTRKNVRVRVCEYSFEYGKGAPVQRFSFIEPGLVL